MPSLSWTKRFNHMTRYLYPETLSVLRIFSWFITRHPQTSGSWEYHIFGLIWTNLWKGGTRKKQGRAETCVIALPQSFHPGCCSCCCLEHLCLIRGKWVVRTPTPPWSVSVLCSNAFSWCLPVYSLCAPSSVLTNHMLLNTSDILKEQPKDQSFCIPPLSSNPCRTCGITWRAEMDLLHLIGPRTESICSPCPPKHAKPLAKQQWG